MCGTASAGTVTGVVQNGTSGKPAAGVDIVLLQLQGGMQSVATTKTDAKGNYKLDNAAIGQGPMLIRAIYRGVFFHQPLTPGKTSVDVTVYEPSSDPKTVQVGSRLIVFQPTDAMLLVGEEYSLQNQSKPPVAYFKQQGDFEFEIPAGADLGQASSWGPSGMPVVQGTIDKGNRHFAIAYAFQPGDNGVRLSYHVPYPGNHTTLQLASPYAIQRVMLVAPPTMQIASPGFISAGNEQGFNLYTRDAMPAGLPFEVTVSGTAPPPSAQPGAGDQGAAAQGQPGDQGQGAPDQVNGRSSGPAIRELPNRLDSLRWILIGGLAMLFALGVAFVWRRPIAFVADGAGSAAVKATPQATAANTSRRAQKRNAEAAAVAAATGAVATVATNGKKDDAANSAPSNIQQIEHEVEQNLDGLKDKLFRLELRRQAGTISEEDYARERSVTERILRELVQG